MIERCKNCKITLSGKILTSVVEVWKCENFVLTVDTQIGTLQLDLCQNLTINYTKKEHFASLIWAGIYDLHINFLDDSSLNIATGFEQMRKLYTDINDKFDQFIIRFINGKVVSEQIIRLENGFPTTKREADAFDKRAKKMQR